MQIRSTGYVKGVAPSDNYYQGVRFYDDETSNSENHIVGGFETQYSTSGYNISNINCRNYDQNNVQLNYSVGLYVPNDSTRPIQFVPAVNNVVNLGSPSYQWNNTYTRHILIDNDINIWSSVINKTSNSGSLSLRGGTYYTDGASLALYGKDYNGGLSGCFTFHAYGNYDYTYVRIYPNGTMNVYNNSTNTTKNIAMQEDVIPRSGGAVMTGTTLGKTTDNSYDTFCGGVDFDNGASVRVHGKDYTDSNYAGTILIRAKNNSNVFDLFLKPDGAAMWGNKNLAMQEDTIPRSGGEVISGQEFKRTVDDSTLNVYGGKGYGHGAFLQLTGKDDAGGGGFSIQAHNGSTNVILKGKADGTLTWKGQSIQTVSDQRLKQQISEIDDKLLDAWSDVDLVQFKYNDAVDQKGDNARLHTGYVVQQIDEVCKSHNLDISAYGLYCHEEYPEETEEVEVEQEDGTIKKETKVIEEASEHYSLRYTEIYAVECAYLRRENDKLKQQFKQLEETVNELKSIINYSEIPNS